MRETRSSGAAGVPNQDVAAARGQRPFRSSRVRFAGGNGFELAGIVDVPRADNQPRAAQVDHGAMPVVVFSHCFTCNKDFKAIVRLSRAMAASGVAVLRYDLTGLGGSEGDFSHTNFSTNLADLRAAIGFAQQRFGHVTGLLGLSFGGAATLAVAGAPEGEAEPLPASIRALATLAAPSDTQHLAQLLQRRDPDVLTAGHGEVEIGGRRWTIRRQMLDDFRSHSLGQRISRIDRPLMVLHSPADTTVGFDHALRIMQLVSIRADESAAPSTSLIALDGADHLLAERAEDIEYVARLLSAYFWRYCG